MFEIKTTFGSSYDVETPQDQENLEVPDIVQSVLNGNFDDTQRLTRMVRDHLSGTNFKVKNGVNYPKRRPEETLVRTVGPYSISIGSSYYWS